MTGLPTIHLIKLIFQHLDDIFGSSPYPSPLIFRIYSPELRAFLRGGYQMSAAAVTKGKAKLIFLLVLDIPFMASPQTAYRNLTTGFQEQ